jgi:hypothetical protein
MLLIFLTKQNHDIFQALALSFISPDSLTWTLSFHPLKKLIRQKRVQRYKLIFFLQEKGLKNFKKNHSQYKNIYN